MSRRKNPKVDYKVLHEGCMANSKVPSSEDSMINMSHQAHDSTWPRHVYRTTDETTGQPSEGGGPDCPPPPNRKTKGGD